MVAVRNCIGMVDCMEQGLQDCSTGPHLLAAGSTALHLTGLHEVASIEIARLLLAAKANVNQVHANLAI